MPDYDSPHERHRLAVLSSLVPHGRGLAVDLGCGDGTVTELLVAMGYDPVGLDIDAGAIARGRRLGPHSIYAWAPPMPRRRWRLGPSRCASRSSSTSTPKTSGDCCRRIAAATPVGGRLLLSTPGRFSLFSLCERARRANRPYDWWDPTDIGIVSWRRLRQMLTGSGFEVEGLTGFHYLPQRFVSPFGCTVRPLARSGLRPGRRRCPPVRAVARP